MLRQSNYIFMEETTMSIKKEIKIQKVLDATQAAEFFHTLGMAIAWAGDERLAELGLPLSGFEKIKLSIKKEGDLFSLKVKVKEAETASLGEESVAGAIQGTEPVGKPSYKSLKKKLKSSFSELKKLLTQDVPPNTETVRRFLDESDCMLTFPGMGDEHYEEYKRCCQEFEKAFESGDLEAMRTSLSAVECRKKACHQQYK